MMVLTLIQKKVIGFSSVTPTIIFVGNYDKRIREVGGLSPLEVDSPVQFYCLSRFYVCAHLGSQFIFLVNQECLFSY